MLTTAQRLMKWASDIHLARETVEKIRREMAVFQCQHELAVFLTWDLYDHEFSPARHDEDARERPAIEEDGKPCWKGQWVHLGSYEGSEYRTLGDNRDGGWCGPCEAREKFRKSYAAARKRLGSLKGALWRLAAKAHAEVEAELDDAGKPDARVRVVRLQLFRADCGHKFKTDDQAVSHMTRCWKSPQTRTCKTCKHGHHAQYEEETGHGGEWECRNPEMLEEDFTPAHEKAPDICIRCPKWESKR